MALKVKGELAVGKGLGFPRQTTAQRLAYTPSAEGFAVYDTDLDQVYTWDGATWNVSGGAAPVDSVNGQTGVVVLDAGDLAVTPTGDLTATDIQAALVQLQGYIDALEASAATDYIAGNSAGAAPSNAIGEDGNYFLDVSTGDVYGPKAAGVWPAAAINNVFDTALSNATPLIDGIASAGTGTLASREDHVHPAEPIDNATDVDTTTTAPVVGEYLQWDGTNWVPAAVSAASYEQSFATGDWTVGTPNTLSITAATHGLPVKDNYDMVFRDATGAQCLVCNKVDASGNVTLETVGDVFAGRVKISC